MARGVKYEPEKEAGGRGMPLDPSKPRPEPGFLETAGNIAGSIKSSATSVLMPSSGPASDAHEDLPENLSRMGSMILEGANEVSRGVTSFWGQTELAERAGIGTDATPEGENPSLAQGALRMVGMAAGAAPALMYAAATLPMRVGSALEYSIYLANQARTVAPAGGWVGLKQSVTGFLKNSWETAVRNPKTVAATEVGFAATAGAAGAAIYNQTESDTAKAFAELLGGTAPAAVLPITRLLYSHSPTGYIVRSARALFGDKSVGKSRASDRIRRSTDDPEGALQRADSADVLADAPLTTIQKTEDPGLLSLEANVRASSDKLTRESRAQFSEVNRVIKEAADNLEPGEVKPGQARDYMAMLMDERIRIAGVTVQDRLAMMGAGADSEVATRMARDELETALKAVEDQESALYDLVSDTLAAPITRTLKAYQERLLKMLDDRVSAARIDEVVPVELRKFLGGFQTITPEPSLLALPPGVKAAPQLPETKFVPGILNENVTSKEVKELRSLILAISRTERAQPGGGNRRKIAFISEIQGELLGDLSAVQPDDALDIARAFSTDLNTRFRNGDVGRILGFAKAGDPAVDPLMTLQSIIGKSKLASAAGLDKLLSAADMGNAAARALSGKPPKPGDVETMTSHVTDYVLDEFLRATTRNGQTDFNLSAARIYVANKADVLERLPRAKALMETAIKEQNTLEVTRAIVSSKKSTAAIVLGAPPGKEVSALRESTDVARAAKETRALLNTDETGVALSGFRQAIVEDLMGGAMSPADNVGEQFLQGFSLGRAMDDPNMKVILNEFMAPDQLRRLNQIRNTATALERSMKTKGSQEAIMDDKEGVLTEFVRRMVAASLGRSAVDVVGLRATVQGPGMAVSLSQKLAAMGMDPARKLVIDAVLSHDDKLLRAILNPGRVSEKFLYTQLNGWATAAAAQYGIDLTESESETGTTP